MAAGKDRGDANTSACIRSVNGKVDVDEQPAKHKTTWRATEAIIRAS
jgi:hypothetical protein